MKIKKNKISRVIKSLSANISSIYWVVLVLTGCNCWGKKKEIEESQSKQGIDNRSYIADGDEKNEEPKVKTNKDKDSLEQTKPEKAKYVTTKEVTGKEEPSTIPESVLTISNQPNQPPVQRENIRHLQNSFVSVSNKLDKPTLSQPSQILNRNNETIVIDSSKPIAKNNGDQNLINKSLKADNLDPREDKNKSNIQAQTKKLSKNPNALEEKNPFQEENPLLDQPILLTDEFSIRIDNLKSEIDNSINLLSRIKQKKKKAIEKELREMAIIQKKPLIKELKGMQAGLNLLLKRFTTEKETTKCEEMLAKMEADYRMIDDRIKQANQ